MSGKCFDIIPTMVSHLVVVVELCTDNPKNFSNLKVRS